MSKILIVSNMYPSKKYPHYGIFVDNIAKILECDGNNVKVIGLTKQDHKIIKLFYYIFFYIKAIYHGIFGHYDFAYGHYISHVSLVLRIIKTLNPKIKIILNAHGNDVVAEEDWMYKNKIRTNKILPFAYKVIVPSLYFYHILKDEYQVPENKLVIYPSGGVNLNVFKPLDKIQSKAHFHFDENTKYIGYVSRIETHKGWEVFLESAKQLIHQNYEYKFLMIGDGMYSQKLDELIKEYQLENAIIRIPFLNQIELSYIYNSLDLFVFPTYRKSESLGLVGLEAMACGCPIIAANNYGPTSYIVDHVNGFFFESLNPTDLTEKIKHALSIDLYPITQNALETARQYSSENTKYQICEVFKDE